jgi:hypothetical protein
LILSDPESQPINALPEYPIEAAVAELRFPPLINLHNELALTAIPTQVKAALLALGEIPSVPEKSSGVASWAAAAREPPYPPSCPSTCPLPIAIYVRRPCFEPSGAPLQTKRRRIADAKEQCRGREL